MNYIVLDLEWNQSADGKAYTNSRIPFEIIQIGAVKLDENFSEISQFDRYIRPAVYTKLHDKVQEILNVTIEELSQMLQMISSDGVVMITSSAHGDRLT